MQWRKNIHRGLYLKEFNFIVQLSYCILNNNSEYTTEMYAKICPNSSFIEPLYIHDIIIEIQYILEIAKIWNYPVYPKWSKTEWFLLLLFKAQRIWNTLYIYADRWIEYVNFGNGHALRKMVNLWILEFIICCLIRVILKVCFDLAWKFRLKLNEIWLLKITEFN